MYYCYPVCQINFITFLWYKKRLKSDFKRLKKNKLFLLFYYNVEQIFTEFIKQFTNGLKETLLPDEVRTIFLNVFLQGVEKDLTFPFHVNTLENSN